MSKETYKCDICIHKGVCGFSNKFITYCNEILKLGTEKEYQMFGANPYCQFFRREDEGVKHKSD